MAAANTMEDEVLIEPVADGNDDNFTERGSIGGDQARSHFETETEVPPPPLELTQVPGQVPPVIAASNQQAASLGVTPSEILQVRNDAKPTAPEVIQGAMAHLRPMPLVHRAFDFFQSFFKGQNTSPWVFVVCFLAVLIFLIIFLLFILSANPITAFAFGIVIGTLGVLSCLPKSLDSAEADANRIAADNKTLENIVKSAYQHDETMLRERNIAGTSRSKVYLDASKIKQQMNAKLLDTSLAAQKDKHAAEVDKDERTKRIELDIARTEMEVKQKKLDKDLEQKEMEVNADIAKEKLRFESAKEQEVTKRMQQRGILPQNGIEGTSGKFSPSAPRHDVHVGTGDGEECNAGAGFKGYWVNEADSDFRYSEE